MEVSVQGLGYNPGEAGDRRKAGEVKPVKSRPPARSKAHRWGHWSSNAQWKPSARSQCAWNNIHRRFEAVPIPMPVWGMIGSCVSWYRPSFNHKPTKRGKSTAIKPGNWAYGADGGALWLRGFHVGTQTRSFSGPGDWVLDLKGCWSWEIAGLVSNPANWRFEVVTCMNLSAPYEKSKSLGSGGSVVERLKLKGILTEGHRQEWSLRLNLTLCGEILSRLCCCMGFPFDICFCDTGDAFATCFLFRKLSRAFAMHGKFIFREGILYSFFSIKSFRGGCRRYRCICFCLIGLADADPLIEEKRFAIDALPWCHVLLICPLVFFCHVSSAQLDQKAKPKYTKPKT